jgi:hypothetical protein
VNKNHIYFNKFIHISKMQNNSGFNRFDIILLFMYLHLQHYSSMRFQSNIVSVFLVSFIRVSCTHVSTSDLTALIILN